MTFRIFDWKPNEFCVMFSFFFFIADMLLLTLFVYVVPA